MNKIFNTLARFSHEGSDNIENFEHLHLQSSLFALGLQQYLKQYSIPKTDVEIFLDNTFHFAIAFFGCLMADIHVHILSQNTPNKKKLYINNENFYAFFAPHNFYNIKEPLSLDPQATFYIKTTGASGETRYIPKTIEQMVKEAQFLAKFLHITPQNIIFSSLSHQYLYGISFKIFIPLVSGAKVNNATSNDTESILSFTQKRQDDELIFITVPKVLQKLVQEAPQSIFDPITTIITSRSPLSQSTRDTLSQITQHRKKPLRLVDLYANTETGAIGINEGDGLKAFECVNVELDSENRLIVESEWQKNIYNNKKTITDDCAELKGKEIRLLGRHDRLIDIQGTTFHLNDIEQEIKNHAFIEDIFTGITRNTQQLNALIVLSEEGKKFFHEHGKRSLVEALQEHLKEELQEEIAFHIRRELPYNTQGKITKTAFKACLAQRNDLKLECLIYHESLILAEAYIGEDCNHFENSPFMAGFIQLGLVCELLDQHWDIKHHHIAQINHIEFTQPIRPLDSISIKITRNGNSLHFNIKANQQSCTTGNIILNDHQSHQTLWQP